MAMESLYLGIGIGTLAAAIALRYLRYKTIKGGERYEKVRYPDDGGEERTTPKAYGYASTNSPGLQQQNISSSFDGRRGQMEVGGSSSFINSDSNSTTPIRNKPTSTREQSDDENTLEKLRSIIKSKRGN